MACRLLLADATTTCARARANFVESHSRWQAQVPFRPLAGLVRPKSSRHSLPQPPLRLRLRHRVPLLTMGGAASKPDAPPAAYNVYNQRLDPTNNMPVVANQLPWPGQKELLSTERVPSTIAKGGGGRWVFPSQQMFYNALQRKGKGDDVTEADMPSVIDVHNTMNELTWRQVLIWERLRTPGRASEPALVRFLGRPDSLSPRARMRTLTGGASPACLCIPSLCSHAARRRCTLRPPRLVRGPGGGRAGGALRHRLLLRRRARWLAGRLPPGRAPRGGQPEQPGAARADGGLRVVRQARAALPVHGRAGHRGRQRESTGQHMRRDR